MNGKTLLLTSLVVALAVPRTFAQAKLGDLTELDGVRDNVIIGLGLVSGLNGTGDSGTAARTMASNLVRRMNLNISPEQIKSGNLAVVTVTATVAPFKRNGDRVDVTVSAFGEASNLFGGELLPTQLMGPNGRDMYAVASGPVFNGAPGAQGGSGTKEQINHPTVGRIPGGAIIEREIPQKILTEEGNVRMRLRNSSFVTARNVVDAINRIFPKAAKAVDGVTIVVVPPPAAKDDPVPFLASLNDIRVAVDAKAKVVISERTGTIVAGDNVTILPCAISQGSLSVSVAEAPQVSQPNPLSDGRTAVVPRSDVKIAEKGIEMRALPGVTTAGELARALNTLGVSPRELITIFQMLKANGALVVDLEVQ